MTQFIVLVFTQFLGIFTCFSLLLPDYAGVKIMYIFPTTV